MCKLNQKIRMGMEAGSSIIFFYHTFQELHTLHWAQRFGSVPSRTVFQRNDVGYFLGNVEGPSVMARKK